MTYVLFEAQASCYMEQSDEPGTVDELEGWIRLREECVHRGL